MKGRRNSDFKEEGSCGPAPGERDFKGATPFRAANIPELAKPQILHVEILEDAEAEDVRSRPPFSRNSIGISAVITKALETAGLIKRG